VHHLEPSPLPRQSPDVQFNRIASDVTCSICVFHPHQTRATYQLMALQCNGKKVIYTNRLSSEKPEVSGL
jgi:hypothetical protein